MGSKENKVAPFQRGKKPPKPQRKLEAEGISTMGLILATHVDENVNLFMRYDKAANPDGTMLVLDGILQSHPVVTNAFILITPPKDGQPALTHDICADDVVDCVTRAPDGLIDVLIARAQAKAAKDSQDAQAMSQEALAGLKENQPVIHKP